MLIGIQPRSPAIPSVSDFSETPATAIGGWGFWNGWTWTCFAIDRSGFGTVKVQEWAWRVPGVGSPQSSRTVSMESSGQLALHAGRRVDADHLEVADEAAGADAPHEPSARHMIELGDPVGEMERVVIRQAGHAGRRA